MIYIITALADYPRLALLGVLAYLIAILFAIVLHEMAHGWVAYLNGDYTAKMSGRLSLNPFKHIDPIGFLLMLVVGFGWAKPVPVDPRNFRDYKKGMITVSIAGVVCNFIVAFLAAAVYAILLACTKNVDLTIYVGQEISAGQYAFFFFSYLFQYSIIFNLTLMAFNLLPIYPLDGFRLFETLKPSSKYVDFMYRYGNYALLILIIASTLLGNISPYLDIFGMYINLVRKGVLALFNLIFGVNIL
ncbi:MAG: site-2 protease family protein [Christensenellales bacterium]